MISNFLNELKVLNTYRIGGDSFDIDDARMDFSCAHCGSKPINKVAEVEGQGYALFCPNCMKPSVVWLDHEGNPQFAPVKQPSQAPMGTPKGIAEAWFEGDRCFYAGAYNAASMIYRRLIFLVAVNRGMPATDKGNSSPSFAKCLGYLVSEGYISDRDHRIWADTIRTIGNNAAHKIKPITDDQAEVSRYFIRTILETVYEREVLAKKVRGA